MLDVKKSKNSNPVKLLRLSTKQNPEKLQKIKNLFDLDQEGEAENSERKTNTKIKVKYNETIFFKLKEIKKNDEIHDISLGMTNQKQLNKIIDSVISSQITGIKSTGSSIKVNLNINNNYYNSNYNYVVNTKSAALTTTTLEDDDLKFSSRQDENNVTGFLSKKEN
jgi:hypothetical protein